MKGMVAIRPIRTDADFDAAVVRISELVSSMPGTPDFDELEVLSTLAETYDKRFRPNQDEPPPLQVIQFVMEQRGLTPQDLTIYFGSQSRVSDFLAGKRHLTLEQIRRLSLAFSIPAGMLIGEPDELWRVPSNRRSQVLDITKRENLPGGYVRFSLQEHFGGRQVGQSTLLSDIDHQDFEVMSENDLIYLDSSTRHAFPCRAIGEDFFIVNRQPLGQ
jgi:HTH-type transcriptional regulator/antitoxin HigA